MTDQQHPLQLRDGSRPAGSRSSSSAYTQTVATDGDDGASSTTTMTAIFSPSDRSSSSVYSFDTVYTASATSTVEEGPLVCEFRDLLGCPWSFGAHEVDGWVAHVASHLGGRFPAKSLCWFCDDGVFDSGENKSSSSSSNTKSNKRRLQFERRLRHVADHVVGDGYYTYTYTHMRPDFYVIRHLHHHGIIDGATFEQCMQYTELPESLRRMRQAGADKPGASVPRVSGVRNKTGGQVVVFDQAREDRLRKKEEKEKKKKTKK